MKYFMNKPKTLFLYPDFFLLYVDFILNLC